MLIGSERLSEEVAVVPVSDMLKNLRLLVPLSLQTHGWSPERAVSHVQEKRPHVWFRGIQLQALEEFAALQQRSSAGDDSH